MKAVELKPGCNARPELVVSTAAPTALATSGRDGKSNVGGEITLVASTVDGAWKARLYCAPYGASRRHVASSSSWTSDDHDSRDWSDSAHFVVWFVHVRPRPALVLHMCGTGARVAVVFGSDTALEGIISKEGRSGK